MTSWLMIDLLKIWIYVNWFLNIKVDEKVARDIIATNGALILENIRVMENIIDVNNENYIMW